MLSQEEIIESINERDFDEKKYYKLIVHQNFIKIKDETKLEVNLEKLSKQNNLKGIFIKNLLERLKEHPEEKEKIEKAIEIGLDAF